jgi:hypothetical protein
LAGNHQRTSSLLPVNGASLRLKAPTPVPAGLIRDSRFGK